MQNHWNDTLCRLVLAVGAAWALAAPASAWGQASPERAEQLNLEGKALFKDGRYFEASKKFRQAVLAAPQPRYYFNLCFSLNVLERYAEALEQCELGRAQNPDAELRGKIDKLMVELRKRVPATPAPTPPPSGGPTTQPPTAPPPTPSGTPPPGTAPPPGPAFVETNADRAYRWSFGGELGVLANLNVGKTGMSENYSGSGGQLRLFSNFVFGQSRIGTRGYLGFALIPSSGTNLEGDLTIIDVGGGLFYDVPITQNLLWTPCLGVHVGVFQPVSGPNQTLPALGARVESTFSLLLGRRGQHALTVTPSYSIYGTPLGADERQFEALGLNQSSSTFTVAFGYTARFDTPFGRSPILSLE